MKEEMKKIEEGMNNYPRKLFDGKVQKKCMILKLNNTFHNILIKSDIYYSNLLLYKKRKE